MNEKEVREAIEYFKKAIALAKEDREDFDNEEWKKGCDHEVWCCETAIEALEKQLPKKVVIWNDGTEHCPVCEKNVTCTGFNVCPECYQRLDWSE